MSKAPKRRGRPPGSKIERPEALPEPTRADLIDPSDPWMELGEFPTSKLRKMYERCYQEPYYKMGDHRRARAASFLARARNSGQTVLDAGCGRGEAFQAALELGFVPTGLDLVNPSNLSPFIEADIRRLDAVIHKQFDIVICLDVLEHLPECDVEGVIASLWKITRKRLLLGVNWGEDHFHRKMKIADPLHLTLKGPPWWKEKTHSFNPDVYAFEEHRRQGAFIEMWKMPRRAE